MSEEVGQEEQEASGKKVVCELPAGGESSPVGGRARQQVQDGAHGASSEGTWATQGGGWWGGAGDQRRQPALAGSRASSWRQGGTTGVFQAGK